MRAAQIAGEKSFLSISAPTLVVLPALRRYFVPLRTISASSNPNTTPPGGERKQKRMWKTNTSVVPVPAPSPVPTNHQNSLRATMQTAVSEGLPSPNKVLTAHDQATIGKGLLLKGDISGMGSLYIDGAVEGSINLPGERVTIGSNGRVTAGMMTSSRPCILAKELIIMGQVFGNVSASDRVDIRTDGSLTGDITTARVSIADGAFFKGGIDIRKSEPGLLVAKPQDMLHDEMMDERY